LGLSRGTGEPQPTPRLELTTVELQPGAEKAFESALGAEQSKLQNETLWYRMIEGGNAPRYVRSVRVPASLRSSMERANRRCPSSLTIWERTGFDGDMSGSWLHAELIAS
jgi:hypothetical protein